jgi:hypothetical protein
MKRLVTHLLPIGVVAALVAIAPVAAHAFTLRSPQVGFSSASLASYLTSQSQTINVTTDQLDAQVWTTSLSGNSTFTLMAQLTPGSAANEIGVYNAYDAAPTLFTVLPAGAGAGWYATVHFGGGGLSVTLFDNNAVFQSSTNYTGVTQSKFCFYIKGPNGTFYSQDWRNPSGAAQVLTYGGTGTSYGTWWECFEDTQYNAATSDFDDAVLNLQSVVTTPTRTKSWGGVKSDFR